MEARQPHQQQLQSSEPSDQRQDQAPTSLLEIQVSDIASQVNTDAARKMEVHHLNFFYGAKQALFDVSLPIPERQVTALIGPSGCGKSLRTLNRMNEFVAGTRLEGEAWLDGQNIYAPDIDVIHLRQRIGMVFQRANPFPGSIFENVAYALRLRRQPRQRIRDRVEACLRGAALWEEVKDRLQSSAQGLSGGQQQQLCIARAIADHPEVILMDEPCSALDPIATLRVEELITQLSQDYTIVLVTHNMQQAARVSHYTGFFLQGKLIE